MVATIFVNMMTVCPKPILCHSWLAHAHDVAHVQGWSRTCLSWFRNPWPKIRFRSGFTRSAGAQRGPPGAPNSGYHPRPRGAVWAALNGVSIFVFFSIHQPHQLLLFSFVQQQILHIYLAVCHKFQHNMFYLHIRIRRLSRISGKKFKDFQGPAMWPCAVSSPI